MVQSGVRIKPHFDHVDIRDKTLATATEMAEGIVENSFKMGLGLGHDCAADKLILWANGAAVKLCFFDWRRDNHSERGCRSQPVAKLPRGIGRERTPKVNDCSHFR